MTPRRPKRVAYRVSPEFCLRLRALSYQRHESMSDVLHALVDREYLRGYSEKALTPFPLSGTGGGDLSTPLSGETASAGAATLEATEAPESAGGK